MCDTFMGWFVRSRDVKSVPPVALSKSKGGRKKEFLSSGYAGRSCPNVAGVPLPLPAAGLGGAAGKSGVQTSSRRVFHVSSVPQIHTERWEDGRAASSSSALMRADSSPVRRGPGFCPQYSIWRGSRWQWREEEGPSGFGFG